eukprot:1235540-Lingulodinium_polyedra.AAC.1
MLTTLAARPACCLTWTRPKQPYNRPFWLANWRWLATYDRGQTKHTPSISAGGRVFDNLASTR